MPPSHGGGLSPIGFAFAPVVRFSLIFLLMSSTFVSTFELTNFITLLPQRVVHNAEIWRLLTHCLFFNIGVDFFVGLFLLYLLRVLERLYGSTRFLIFCFWSWLVYTTMAFLISFSFSLKLSPGPWGLLFGLIVQYFCDIPEIYHLRMFPLVTDKWFIYILLMIARKPTFYSGCIGLATGVVLRFLPMSFKCPYRLGSAGARIFAWVIPNSLRATRRRSFASPPPPTPPRLPRNTHAGSVPPPPSTLPASSPPPSSSLPLPSPPPPTPSSLASSPGAGSPPSAPPLRPTTHLSPTSSPADNESLWRYVPRPPPPDRELMNSVDPGALEEVMALGFPPEAAARALIASGGDVIRLL